MLLWLLCVTWQPALHTRAPLKNNECMTPLVLMYGYAKLADVVYYWEFHLFKTRFFGYKVFTVTPHLHFCNNPPNILSKLIKNWKFKTWSTKKRIYEVNFHIYFEMLTLLIKPFGHKKLASRHWPLNSFMAQIKQVLNALKQFAPFSTIVRDSL